LALGLLSVCAFAGVVPAGFMSYDVNIPNSTAAFDIVNMTGSNSTGDPTFPISTTVNLSSLSLMVDFSSGPPVTYGPSYFTLSLDGISWDGGDIPIGGTSPIPVDATLTGVFSPTALMLFDSSTPNILPGFSATLFGSGSGGMMQDGDNVIINATEAPSGGAVPEPSSWILMAAGVALLALAVRWRSYARLKAALSESSPVRLALLVSCVALLSSSSWAAVVVPVTVKLNVATAPSTGVAGISFVNATGSGFPATAIVPGNIKVSLAPSCGGAASATTSASTITTIVDHIKRVNFQIPGTLAVGTYYVSLSDAADPTPFTSSNCSAVAVTHTSKTLSACVPTSSLGILAPPTAGPVTAYVPNGAWSSATPGIQVVPVEPVGIPTSVATPNVVNSCSSNPATGETVCVANNTDVYLLTGTTLNTTLSSGSTTTAGFSGGTCENCGVAIDALTNRAVISMGLLASPSTSGLQYLDLGTNTFGAPFPTVMEVSEDISIDPTRALILSPNEADNYDLLQTTAAGVLTEFVHNVPGGGSLDSAAEDCSTGIALASIEFTNNVYITDLTQATFVSGGPGTWSAPEQVVTLDTSVYNVAPYNGFSAGTSGISVAPGSAHLGIVTGEFGGSVFAVLKLPATSGSGTPNFVDYAVASIPTFSAGLDPHTVTAYTSANDGKAYGLLANSPPPAVLARVDLQCVLSAPRALGFPHAVDPAYDLVLNGCIKFIPTH
jgi:hypothetical protein